MRKKGEIWSVALQPYVSINKIAVPIIWKNKINNVYICLCYKLLPLNINKVILEILTDFILFLTFFWYYAFLCLLLCFFFQKINEDHERFLNIFFIDSFRCTVNYNSKIFSHILLCFFKEFEKQHHSKMCQDLIHSLNYIFLLTNWYFKNVYGPKIITVYAFEEILLFPKGGTKR